MYRYAYDPQQSVICYLERLKAVMRDLKAINWGPTDESVRKVIWHTTEAAVTKWTMSIINCRLAMSRFIIEYGCRLNGHL